MKFMGLMDFNFLLDHALDGTKVDYLVSVTERKRHALGACTRGAPDAMHITLRFVGQIEVDHVGHIINVNSSRRDVRRNKYPYAAISEPIQGSLSGRLRLISMNRITADVAMSKILGHTICTVLCSREHDCSFNIELVKQSLKELSFITFLYEQHTLLDTVGRFHGWPDVNALVVGEDALGEFYNGIWHRRRKKKRLSFSRKFSDNFSNIVDKSHIQHSVGFVQDENFDLVQPNMALIHQVQEATRCGNQRIYATTHPRHLRTLAHAAEYYRVVLPHVTAINFHVGANLDRQFTSGSEY